MTIHEVDTALSPAEVFARAAAFFPLAGSAYAAFPEPARSGYLQLRMEVGEMVIAASQTGGVTRVRGSASRGEHLLTRFLATLSSPLDVSQTTRRHGLLRVRGARTETFEVADPALLSRPAA